MPAPSPISHTPDPARRPSAAGVGARCGCTLPVRGLIVITTLTSTCVSLVGGLYLYAESVSALEHTMRRLSAADADGAARVVAESYRLVEHVAYEVEVALRPPLPKLARGRPTEEVLSALTEVVERTVIPVHRIGIVQRVVVIVASDDDRKVRDNSTAMMVWMH
eukprot:gene6679-2689_t